MADKAAPPNLPAGVTTDALGRLTAPLELLVPFDNNPRNPDDFDPDKSSAFAALVSSIDQVGVREPIYVYEQDGRLQMQNGHRRRRAVMIVNDNRERAYQARLKLGQVDPDEPRPPELAAIPGLPIVLVEPPASRFDLEADMWLSEAQRQKWPIDRMVPFYRETFFSAPETFRESTRELAGRLGLREDRVRLLNAIVSSDVLFAAAIDRGETALPVPGREKTLRSINNVALNIVSHRKEVALRATGRHRLDADAEVAVRKLVLEKAKEYASVYKRPAGVSFERIGPKLRWPDEHPDDEIVAWLTMPGTIAEETLPTTIGSSQLAKHPHPPEIAGKGQLLAVAKDYDRQDPTALSADDLGALISEITEAGELLDGLLAAAKTERRSRVQ